MLPQIHDESGHLTILDNPTEIILHLRESPNGHNLSVRELSALQRSVSSSRIAEYRWRTRRVGDEWDPTDALMIAHERLHDAVENPFLVWVRDVHVMLHRRGLNPMAVENQFGGFFPSASTDDELEIDPREFVHELVSALSCNDMLDEVRLTRRNDA